MNDQDLAIRAEIDRILQSETFRASTGLRRLLKFLADKLLSGEADQLKEYSVGIDGLGKSVDYDPRNDPIVRIQTGRLREKLAVYCRDEGKNDPLMIDLPKGHFKLSCTAQVPREEIVPVRTAGESDGIPANVIPAAPASSNSRRLVIGLSAALAAAMVWGCVATFRLVQEKREASAISSGWTPALENLWRPFLSGNKPLIVSYENIPFAVYMGTGKNAARNFFYGSGKYVREQDIADLPELNTLLQTFGESKRGTNAFLAPTGDFSAIFLAAKLVWQHANDVSLVRSSDVSWQQLADHNVLYIGDPKFFAERLASLPIDLDLYQTPEGIRNSRPRSGEPSNFIDKFPTGFDYDGEVYGLITHAPGPLGTTDVISFTSNRSPGVIAGVQWFMTEKYAGIVSSHLRNAGGQIPRYYQAVIRVRFRDGIPVETAYVLHRELSLKK